MTITDFHQLASWFPEPLWLVDSAGTVLEANHAAAQLVSRPLEQLPGANLGEFALDPEAMNNFVRQCAGNAAHTTSYIDFRTGPGNGEERCEVEGASLPEADPSVILIRARRGIATGAQPASLSVEETAPTVRPERSRVLREERARMALEATGMVAWIWNAESEKVEGDSALFCLFGLDPDMVPRLEAFLHQVHPGDRSLFREALWKSLEDSSMHTVHVRIDDAEGAPRWVGTHVKGLRATLGVSRVAAVSFDSTVQKMSEEQNAEVRRLDAIGRLAGGVAHEANNQMTVVLGCANFILKRKDIPEIVREDVEQLKRAAERTAGITAQLLAFGRRQILRPQTIDVNTVVDDLRTALERAVRDRGALHVHLDSRVQRIHADPNQIGQILLNLVFNARDAIPEGGHVLVATQAVTIAPGIIVPVARESIVPGEYAMLVVTDSGPGMDAGTRDRVFEPFFTTKEVGSGTGLGLAMVHGIVKQSQGFIWVESEPGEGATFRILFPVVKSVRDAIRPSSAPEGAGATVSRSILVVDDDPSVQAVIVRALREGGYQVAAANDGEEAVVRLSEDGPFDLVLTDVVMPGMDGKELGDYVRKTGLATRVLYMSGLQDGGAGRFVDDPGARVLFKPMSPDALVEEVRSALQDLPDGATLKV